MYEFLTEDCPPTRVVSYLSRLQCAAEAIFEDGLSEAVFHFLTLDAFEDFIDAYVWGRNDDIVTLADEVEFFNQCELGWRVYLHHTETYLALEYEEEFN